MKKYLKVFIIHFIPLITLVICTVIGVSYIVSILLPGTSVAPNSKLELNFDYQSKTLK